MTFEVLTVVFMGFTLLGCNGVLLGKWFLSFFSIKLPSSLSVISLDCHKLSKITCPTTQHHISEERNTHMSYMGLLGPA